MSGLPKFTPCAPSDCTAANDLSCAQATQSEVALLYAQDHVSRANAMPHKLNSHMNSPGPRSWWTFMQMAQVGKVVVRRRAWRACCVRLCALAVTMRSRRRIDGGPPYTIDESLSQNLRDDLRGGCARHAVETMEAPAHTEPTERKSVSHARMKICCSCSHTHMTSGHRLDTGDVYEV
jgi:hypothetical protein